MRRNQKIIRYSAQYSKKAKAKRFILNLLLTVLIIVTAGSLGLIITGYVIDDKPTKSSELSLPSSDLSSEPISSDSSISQESSEPDAQPEKVFSAAVFMPQDILLSETKRADFLENAVKQKFQFVIVEAKNTSGTITYQSDIELASRCGAIAQNAVNLKSITDEIHAAGLKNAVIFSALQDPRAASVDYGTSYKYGDSNYTWLDNSRDRGGKPWLNPYLENTQQYLTEITKEIKSSGCDLIIVDRMVFPTQYTSKLNQGNYTVSRQDMLSGLADQLTAAAGDTPVAFRLDGESFFGVNTQQYDGAPTGIRNIKTAAININPEKLLDTDFLQENKISASPAEQLSAVLDEISLQSPEMQIIPVFSNMEITDEIKNCLKEHDISLYAAE